MEPGGPRVLVAHPGAELYGSDRVTLATAAGLKDLGWVVTVTTPEDGPLTEALAAQGVPTRRCTASVLRKEALRPRGLLALAGATVRGAVEGWRLLRELRPSVLYVATTTMPLWILLGRLARCRVVCHVHEAERDASRARQRALALPLLGAHLLIANSAFTADTVGQALPRLRHRTTVVANPVTGGSGSSPARDRLEGPVRLVVAGRLSPRKGQRVAVDALARLTAAGVDARLVLVGSVFRGYEWFEAELRDAIERQELTDRVELVGFRADVARHLADADIVLVPSTGDESFGLAAVEGSLARRPIVVSDKGGLREAAADVRSARLVPPGDAGAVADAVAELVAGWAAVRLDADADAERLVARHDPRRYAEAVQACLLPVGG